MPRTPSPIAMQPYYRCAHCGHTILRAVLNEGHTIDLDTQIQTYCVVLNDAAEVTAAQSRGYVPHDEVCKGAT
jgi:hypothetical protein